MSLSTWIQDKQQGSDINFVIYLTKLPFPILYDDDHQNKPTLSEKVENNTASAWRKSEAFEK